MLDGPKELKESFLTKEDIKDISLKLESTLMPLDEAFNKSHPDLQKLLKFMLIADPAKRGTAAQVLDMALAWAIKVVGVPASVLEGSPATLSKPTCLNSSCEATSLLCRGPALERLQDVTAVASYDAFKNMGASCCCDKEKAFPHPTFLWKQAGGCVIVSNVHGSCKDVPVWLRPHRVGHRLREHRKTKGGRCMLSGVRVEPFYRSYGLPEPQNLTDLTAIVSKAGFSKDVGLRCCCDKGIPDVLSETDHHRSNRCILTEYQTCGKVPRGQRPGQTSALLHEYTETGGRCDVLEAESAAIAKFK